MKTNIYSQHHDHSGWMNKLSFYNDELKVMQKRLEEVNSKNTGAEIRKDIEHFQNQFIIQEKNSNDLRTEIKQGEKEIQNMIAKNPVASDHRKTEDHTAERSNMDSFEENFNKLRKEFNAFLSQHM